MVASSSEPGGSDSKQQTDDVRPAAAGETHAGVAAPPLSPVADIAQRDATAELPFGNFDVTLAPATEEYGLPSAEANGFQRLVLFNWTNGLLVTLGGLTVSFLLCGFWYPYWRIADMDLLVVYNAFLLNDGLPQEFFDHPGYLSIVLLSFWLRFLHAVGILHVHALSELPRIADAAGFADALTHATQAGRVLSFLMAIGLVTAFGFMLRRLVRDWRAAAMGMLALAYSGGLAMQMRIMRTELLAGGFMTIAFLLLLIAAGMDRRAWRPLMVGFAGMLAVLAMLNKIQALFLICTLPLLVLPFGSRAEERSDFWRVSPYAWPAVGASFLAAALAAIPAAQLVSEGLSADAVSRFGLQPLMASELFWSIFGAWIGIGILTFSIVWRVSLAELLTTIGAVAVGIMLGLLALNIQYNPNNVVVLLHPLEQMFQFAIRSNPDLANGLSLVSSERLWSALETIYGFIARRTFVLQSSARPGIFLEWFVIAATIFALRRGERRLALQVGALLATVWFVDLLGMPRGLKHEYFIFTDPVVIIAAVLLIDRLEPLQRHRWAYPVGFVLIASHLIVSQAEPVKHVFKTAGPEVYCDLYHYARKLEHFPFCRN